MDYSTLLNTEQLRPVTDTQGAVLVLAGAGSGKTRVLTYRIAYLIEKCGVSPYNILAITFTNKAAGEMKERIRSVTGEDGMWVMTFHSFCARVLRNDADKLGHNRNFSIYGEAESDRIITRILKEEHPEDTDKKKSIRWHISAAKSIAMTPEQYALRIKDNPDSALITQVYARYEEELAKNNAFDFDDLLLKTFLLFAMHKDVLEKYQDRFLYVHVDEFQDTNKIQFLLVKMLVRKYGNIFVVGDDDQSIYGWRGADVGNILNFKKDYPDCRIYKLERNYRSSGNILKTANKVIANNAGRMGKQLWTEKDAGVEVAYRSLCDDKTEADFVLEQILSLVKNRGYKYSDFAILVRINSLTRVFEDRMSSYGMPYKVIGGFKFYERKEIKDFIAYLRMAVNPADSESITRIINFPKRGIGDVCVEALIAACNARGLSLFEGLKRLDELELAPAYRKKLAAFAALATDLAENKESMPLDEYVKYVFDKVDFYSAYDMDDPEGRTKLENIDQFLTSVHEFCADNPDVKLEEYLQTLSLLTDADETDEGNYITIATIHGVKGLEFRCVFIVGLEEGIFPSLRSDTTTADVEEERRIMYVAITRAQERLWLTNAGRRFRFGKYESNSVSRFVKESGLIAATRRPEERTVHHTVQKALRRDMPKFAASNAAAAKDLSVFKPNAVVMHPKFGRGVINEINGENARIAFDALGVKVLNLRLAPLTIQGE
ncbi:MAG TPA: UvrD-helicase domain-containing protein [Candidatus Caccalectryoclostridium excrementigallinarum]|uniref:DNA 3'-5' helicase n=1 Tax=Candidatus Caccalectryoclostridium excrementigallinarum TaxID=2840710 RepID=A0A9D1MNA5_9FIRM|nr:UvrD-helicase domain-containing protein [Candidatus Caccalectryoclostridium excrementigallinarum]